MHTLADQEAAAKSYHAEEKRRRVEIKRQIHLAAKLGTTVPYDLRTLLDAGVSAATIRKVYRGQP